MRDGRRGFSSSAVRGSGSDAGSRAGCSFDLSELSASALAGESGSVSAATAFFAAFLTTRLRVDLAAFFATFLVAFFVAGSLGSSDFG